MTAPAPSAKPSLAIVIYAMLAAGAVLLFLLTVAAIGRPPGTSPMALDFDPYWSAASMALHGHASDAYDNHLIENFERAHTNVDAEGYLAFYYPPPFLLLCLPLGLLPYVAALITFLAAQAALLWAALTRILRPHWAVLPILAYPGFLMNVFSGQNAGFTAACFAGGLLFLEQRPALAGACLGFLVCKPQMALTIPVALVAARRWRAAAACAATAAALCAASWLALGTGPWAGFLANAPAARSDLEFLSAKWPMMQSAYAALRLAGAPLSLGYAGHALLAAAALATLVLICARRRNPCAEMAALSVTALLTTPFLYDYDVMITAPALAWLAAEASRTAWRPGEKLLCMLLYVFPIIAVAAGRFGGVPLAPLVLALLLAFVARRAFQEGRPGALPLDPGGVPPLSVALRGGSVGRP
jgi:hypothetical protein